MIKIKWFGHSMWKISNDKISIITDPFNFIGYKLPVSETADIVLISHAHSDHNNSALICGDPAIVKAVGKFNIAGINIQTYHTYHDEEKGRKRGNNLLMKFDLEGKTFLHCGDLGHMITEEFIRDIGNVDVMFIPVGGYYTIKAETAKEIVDKIDPIIVFPMHYKTKVVDYPIDQLCEYLKYVDDHKHQNSNEIELTKADFVTKRTITLNYE